MRVAYISRCSRTVKPSKIASNYGQYPIRDLAFSNPVCFVKSCPLMLRLPESGYIQATLDNKKIKIHRYIVGVLMNEDINEKTQVIYLNKNKLYKYI